MVVGNESELHNYPFNDNDFWRKTCNNYNCASFPPSFVYIFLINIIEDMRPYFYSNRCFFILL